MIQRLQNIPLLLAALMWVVLSSVGCERGSETEYDKAVEAQAELEKAREEAAEKISEAEAEAVEVVQEAREEAKDTVEKSKEEAAEMVRDAEQNLQERLDNLSEKPLEPAADPAVEREIVVERKVIAEPAERSELRSPDEPTVE